MIRFDAAGPVAPVGPQGPPTLLRFASPKRYAKQRGSPLWTNGTTSIETNGSGQFIWYLKRSIQFVIDSLDRHGCGAIVFGR